MKSNFKDALEESKGVTFPLDAAIIKERTDVYFDRTQEIVSHFGDIEVTYAVFIRRPVIAACGMAVGWLKNVAKEQGFEIAIQEVYEEGQWVGAGEPLLYVTGLFTRLAPLETLLLQRLGAACVAAHNAYQMATALPATPFLAMDARHCAGFEMQEQMAYAAAVGSHAAQNEGAVGFIGNANDATSAFFDQNHGLGTMPHALIGYAGSTVRAAEMYAEVYPNDPWTVLVDYFGKEITDSLAVCRRFPEKAASGGLSVRLDTHGGRFLEGLDPAISYGIVEKYAPGAIRRYRSESELRDLVGTGVSVAAIWRMREALDEAGFPKVKIVVSSGFNVSKCKTMHDAHAPIDVVGSGSFIPNHWSETYATADIVAYGDELRVKVGREFLLKKVKEGQRGE
ncbi:nicotinate phosphoribosyltransferase [Swingsia samuiensis]|uniref:Nicotinate phosphoribosyltransferase n=1 Tax=Swingsia samuiensis TaxID=1293412 RepID=A0A4Y6UN58_9PROT|nr:nicotinate phosphoribosyltransferase [Swingsia samuiensis]QDH17485.1 nicotinate phosphoribosyltransferase [Swingsia samuiensis]